MEEQGKVHVLKTKPDQDEEKLKANLLKLIDGIRKVVEAGEIDHIMVVGRKRGSWPKSGSRVSWKGGKMSETEEVGMLETLKHSILSKRIYGRPKRR